MPLRNVTTGGLFLRIFRGSDSVNTLATAEDQSTMPHDKLYNDTETGSLHPTEATLPLELVSPPPEMQEFAEIADHNLQSEDCDSDIPQLSPAVQYVRVL